MGPAGARSRDASGDGEGRGAEGEEAADDAGGRVSQLAVAGKVWRLPLAVFQSREMWNNGEGGDDEPGQ